MHDLSGSALLLTETDAIHFAPVRHSSAIQIIVLRVVMIGSHLKRMSWRVSDMSIIWGRGSGTTTIHGKDSFGIGWRVGNAIAIGIN